MSAAVPPSSHSSGAAAPGPVAPGTAVDAPAGSTPPAAGERPPGGLLARLTDIKLPWLFASLLTLIVVTGEAFFDILGGYERILWALGTAIVAELVLARLLAGRKGSFITGYITGNSVLVLTKPAAGLAWPFALGSLIAITSKYALRYRGQHLWNPTNLSFSVLLLLAPGSVAILSHQWSNSLWIVGIIFALGFLVATKARLLHVSGTYALAFVAFAVLRAVVLDRPVLAEIGPITGPMYMLFTFFMITDPKTVLRTRNGRILVVLLIALVECGIRMLDGLPAVPAWLAPLLTAPPIFALFLVGPVAKALEVRRTVPAAAQG